MNGSTDTNPMEVELELNIGKEELEKRVREKIEEFSGLITRELAIESIYKEVFAKNGIVVEGVLEIVKDEEDYNGKPLRIVIIQETKRKVRIAFWGGLAIELRRILIGSRIRVTNCYDKYGLINTGFSSKLEVLERAVPIEDYSELKEGKASIKGLIFEVHGVRERQNGRRIGEFVITDGKRKLRCIVWNGVDRVEKLNVGNIILIEGANIREGEVHIVKTSRLFLKKGKS